MTSMRKISEMLGVSLSTVSRALTRPEMVLPETRDKILAAVETLGYRPNAIAQSFHSGKSFTIVVIVTDITNPFYSRIVKGIEIEAQKLGYSVLLGDTNDELKREQAYADMLLTNRADGLILLHHRFPFQERDIEKAKKLPMVSICIRPNGQDDFPHIIIDNYAASQDISRHLVALGHRKIGAISGQDKGHVTKERLGGLQQVLKEHDIDFKSQWFIEASYSKKAGEQAALALMSLDEPPTAIFCFNDDLAIGAIKAVKSLGLKVPEDVSIVGFDNIDICEYVDPPLTTVDQPAVEMGIRGMQMLYQQMQNEPLQNVVEFKPYELMIRNSTAKAK